MTKEQALKLLHDNMESANLRKHCYAVGAVMRALALRLNADKSADDTVGATSAVADKWEVVGLLHDSDWEKTKGEPNKHTTLTYQWLLDLGEADQEILHAIKTHNYVHTGENPPETKMEWALYCCDELTGFIIAVTLVQPEKKLSSVTSEKVLKKWNKKEFAAAVDRKQIEECEERLGVQLQEFIDISITAMQGIADELGL
ncbi:MAG: phosphohydrolase [Candidatus Blackburnbacteria bacterium]|nr:phosphohydrolase [Candidatus Blackburnbacteria bacterium]